MRQRLWLRISHRLARGRKCSWYSGLGSRTEWCPCGRGRKRSEKDLEVDRATLAFLDQFEA